MSLTMIGDVKIPIIGLGTWQATNEAELEKALNAALEIGYRHIDTATIYQNEHVIGKVLKEWLSSGKLKREDIFITTKLPMTQIHPDLVESAIKESLRKLQLDYVDLYLVHSPIRMEIIEGKGVQPLPTDHLGVWKKMEEQVDAGRARTIGVSNFGVHQIDRIVKNARIPLANTQVELQIYCQQKELRKYCKNNNIVVVAYSSLGSPGMSDYMKKIGRNTAPLPNILNDPVITSIAKKHNRTSAQVILRYITQNDIVVIPKSVKPERLRENFNILDFTLDADDFKAIENLDKGYEGKIMKIEHWNPAIKDHPEFPHKHRS